MNINVPKTLQNITPCDFDFVRFVPGTSVGTGTWSKSNGETGVRGTTNTNEISFINPSDGDIEIIIHETDAFVDGLVPYGDIP